MVVASDVLWPKQMPKYLREDKKAVSRQRKQDKGTAELLRPVELGEISTSAQAQASCFSWAVAQPSSALLWPLGSRRSQNTHALPPCPMPV